MTFEQVTMTPHELATFTDVSNALLEDNAYGLEGELLQDFAESFAKTEGQAFVSGDGVGKPKGILAEDNGIAEMNTGAAANFPGADPSDVLIAMFHKIPTVFAQSGVFRTYLGNCSSSTPEPLRPSSQTPRPTKRPLHS